MSAIAFSRTIGPVPITCVLTESHDSSIEITGNPIETGAEVHDHAYILPKAVHLEVADANATTTWKALVRFQESRVPFTLVTGLDVYKNMLIKSVQAERDATYSTILKASVELQEVIIVDTAYAAAQEGDDTTSGKPGGEKSSKSARPNSTRSGDSVTADRTSGTVQRGDAPTKAVSTPNSRVSGAFGALGL